MKKTDIKEIGKTELINSLFNNTEYKNIPTQKYLKSATGYITNNKLILEGIDFDLTYTPLKHLGYKTVLLAVGPIYACCYYPKGLSYNIGLSARFGVEQVKEFWEGVLAGAKEHKIENLHLDLGASVTGMSISIGAVGEQTSRTIKNFPQIDKNCLIGITGNLGAAYMGLHEDEFLTMISE